MGSRGRPAGGPDPEETVAVLSEGLAQHGAVTVKSMFGGRGVFVDGTMTAIVDRAGVGYVRGDDDTADAFDAAGAERHGRMPYWRVPGAVWADDTALASWLERAYRTACDHAG